MYSLDEAATLLSQKLNKTVTARQIREFAIHGETILRLLYRGKAKNCITELEEDIYGYPYVLCGFITEIEMHGSYPANQFIYNGTLYKLEQNSGNAAVKLTNDKLLIDEEQLNLLIIKAGNMPTFKFESTSSRNEVNKNKPWELVDPKDPVPMQPWYTPARYFARELVKDDSTLLNKKNILAQKTSKALLNARIFGRYKNKPIAPETILKAFANISLG